MDKRSGLALVLCILIFVGWFWLEPKLFPPAPVPPPPKAAAVPAKPKPPPAAPAAKVEPAPASPAPAERYPVKPPIALKSKYLDVLLTNQGAGIRMVTLHFPKDREEENDTNRAKNLVPILGSPDSPVTHFAVREVGGPDAIESLPWEIADQKDDRVEFRYRLRNGIQLTKEFVVDPTRHTVQMTLMLDNRNAPPAGKSEPADVPITLELVGVDGLDPDSFYKYDQYLTGVASYDHALQMKSLSEIQKGESKLAEALKASGGSTDSADVKSAMEKYLRITGGRKEWFGVKNRFFAAVVLPDNAALDVLNFYEFRTSQRDVVLGKRDYPDLTATARTNELRVGASRRVMQFSLYAGPLEKDTLRELPGAESLGEYTGGCFLAPLIKPAAALILELLRITSRVLFGNMGLGIIVTTLLIRLCMFPLSLKSQRNAMQMQALSPKIQALKERYKDDQQKYGVEQMRLFKEHKVNPVAGCLPVFIQMPIFIGMYSVFEMSIDLRHAPFMWWIRDLSEPDRLLGPWNPVVIPLLITQLRIDALNLLPILMTITWFLQAYFSPRSPDPQMAQQQKMMMWMPIIFGLTCYSLASGLSLYFLANSLLSMAEQRIIKRYILKIDSSGKPLPTTVKEKSKEEGWNLRKG